MSHPETVGQPAAVAGEAVDPLDRARLLLQQVGELPLEQHPEVFAAVDTELRRALQAPPRTG